MGLAGPPGTGKSTVASEMVQRVNKKWPQKAPFMNEQVGSPDIAIVLLMDGFHLYRHQLDAMDISPTFYLEVIILNYLLCSRILVTSVRLIWCCMISMMTLLSSFFLSSFFFPEQR